VGQPVAADGDGGRWGSAGSSTVERIRPAQTTRKEIEMNIFGEKKVTFSNPETLARMVAKEEGFEASAPESKQLKDFQREWENAAAEHRYHSPMQAAADCHANLATLVASVKAGAMRSTDALTIDQLQMEYRQKSSAAMERMRQVCQECFPVAEKVMLRFVKVAEKFALEAREKAEAEHSRFGVPYAPSSLDAALQKVAEFARNRCSNNRYNVASPAQLLPYLEL
jgi:hypothetical protein